MRCGDDDLRAHTISAQVHIATQCKLNGKCVRARAKNSDTSHKAVLVTTAMMADVAAATMTVVAVN